MNDIGLDATQFILMYLLMGFTVIAGITIHEKEAAPKEVFYLVLMFAPVVFIYFAVVLGFTAPYWAYCRICQKLGYWSDF